MQDIKKVTVRLSEYTVKGLSLPDSSLTATATDALEGFVYLKAYTKKELQNVFTKEEWVAMIDRQNGTMLTPSFQASKAAYLAGLEDFETLEQGISRHGANYDELVQKIAALPAATIYFIQHFIDEFWQEGEEIDVFIGSMVKD